MLDRAYRHGLDNARFLAPGGEATGVTVWRERGLEAVDLLVRHYMSALAACGDPVLVSHDFLVPEAGYRAVFPDYHNVYSVRLPEAGGSFVLRPDNMPASVRWLRATRHRGPVVAVGGLLRRCPPPVLPLFRERYIWPAVQVTQLADERTAHDLLNRHQRVLASLLGALGLPVVSVRTPAAARYGHTCYLTVTCLPDGRPTVLSTSFLMATRYREALGVNDQLIDIGFTGKLLAVLAMHHRDQHGLSLPSAIAPATVGVCGAPGRPPDRLAGQLAASGLRVHSMTAAADTTHLRRRCERAMLRLGTPVVLTVGDPPRLTSRGPVRRTPVPAGGDLAHDLRAELARHDARLARHATRRFRRAMEDRDAGLLRQVCADCDAARRVTVFGWVTPHRPGPCAHCGRAGSRALLGDGGRFY